MSNGATPRPPANVPPNRVRIHSRAMLIFLKEFREIFRDSRTRFSAILGPLLMTPAIMLLVGNMVGKQVEKAKTQTYQVGVVNGRTAPLMEKLLQKLPNMELKETTAAEAETAVKDHRFNTAILLPPNTDSLLTQGEIVKIVVLKDDGNQTSQSAAGRVEGSIDAVAGMIVKQRLKAMNLPASFTEPFRVVQKPVSSGGSPGTMMLAMMLPYLLALSAMTGGMYAAFDQVAGEKERGTLETLLVSPASRRDIVLGKFGAVTLVCAISSILSILGLVISFKMKGSLFGMMSKGGFHLSAEALGVTFLVLLLLSVLFAAVLLAISTFARNPKEAQSYAGPLMMLVILPSMMTMFIQTEDARSFALVPVMGACMVIKQALSSSYDTAFILMALGSSLVYALLAGIFAVWLFQKESVLIKA